MTEERHLLTASQLRMARAALRYTASKVAAMSGVSESTIRKLEREEDHATILIATMGRLEGFYRSQGVTFLPADASGAGVCVRHGQGTPEA